MTGPHLMVMVDEMADAICASQAGAAPVSAAPAPAAQPVPFEIQAESLTALKRFSECALDDEGHDIPASMMKVLASIGLVTRRYASTYEITDFGLAVFNGKFSVYQIAPAAQPGERDAALREALVCALDASVTGRGSYGPNYDGNKLAAMVRASTGRDWRCVLELQEAGDGSAVPGC